MLAIRRFAIDLSRRLRKNSGNPGLSEFPKMGSISEGFCINHPVLPSIGTIPLQTLIQEALTVASRTVRPKVMLQHNKNGAGLTPVRKLGISTSGEPPEDSLIAFPDRKGSVLRDKVRVILDGMSKEDLDTLQNDRMGVFQFPQMPSILAEYFHDWNNDYGSGEVGLSHENVHETHAKFYEHIVGHPDEWDKQQVDMASSILAKGELHLRPRLVRTQLTECPRG